MPLLLGYAYLFENAECREVESMNFCKYCSLKCIASDCDCSCHKRPTKAEELEAFGGIK